MRTRVALVLAALPACSLFTSLGDYSQNDVIVYAEGGPDGPAGDGDGGVTGGDDAGGGSDGATGGADAADAGDADAGRPNLHPNGSFDVGCQGWYAYNSTLAGDTTAHSGTGSCRVCATATLSDVATIDEEGAVTDPVVGGVYVASAWFRVADGVNPPPTGAKLVFGTRAQDGSVVQSQPGSYLNIDTTWKQESVELTVTEAAARLRIWAGGKAEAGTCFLIDDVRIERWQ